MDVKARIDEASEEAHGRMVEGTQRIRREARDPHSSPPRSQPWAAGRGERREHHSCLAPRGTHK